MGTEGLEEAVAVARGVLNGVQATQMGDPTPCTKWTVSELINHIVGAQSFFAAGVAGEQPANTDEDYAAGDYVASFDAVAAKTIAAFGAEGALDATLSLPFGEMPGRAFMGMAMVDTFTHSWDLAKATGQSTDLAPDLAGQLLANSKSSIQPAFRSEAGDVFGLEQDAPEGASVADQLAAFLGRTV